MTTERRNGNTSSEKQRKQRYRNRRKKLENKKNWNVRHEIRHLSAYDHYYHSGGNLRASNDITSAKSSKKSLKEEAILAIAVMVTIAAIAILLFR